MSAASQPVARFVTVTMGVVIGLTFLLASGNVLNLALRLGVPVYVPPLVAPAVDLPVLGLLVGTRHLALCVLPAVSSTPHGCSSAAPPTNPTPRAEPRDNWLRAATIFEPCKEAGRPPRRRRWPRRSGPNRCGDQCERGHD